MDANTDLLKTILQRLDGIESLLSAQQTQRVLQKPSYSCAEVAKLTECHGARSYKPFTVRLACKDGRVPEAEKLENGSWRIPSSAVQRILEEGFPPEQRKHQPASS